MPWDPSLPSERWDCPSGIYWVLGIPASHLHSQPFPHPHFFPLTTNPGSGLPGGGDSGSGHQSYGKSLTMGQNPTSSKSGLRPRGGRGRPKAGTKRRQSEFPLLGRGRETSGHSLSPANRMHSIKTQHCPAHFIPPKPKRQMQVGYDLSEGRNYAGHPETNVRVKAIEVPGQY